MGLENAGYVGELARSGIWGMAGVPFVKVQANVPHAEEKVGIRVEDAEVQDFLYIGCTIS